MGWSGGSYVAEQVWDLIKDFIPKNKKKKVAREIIDIMEDQDCDTIDEAEELCEAAKREIDEDTGEVIYK